MKLRDLYPIIIVCCLLDVAPRLLAVDPAPQLPPIPPSLTAPANQEIALVLTARGVQVYECRALVADPATFEWAFQAPEADLFDAGGHKVGRHYAGPTWELADGSKIIGRVKAKTDAPDGRGVAWLLVEAAEKFGTGVLGKVQSVQRLSTVGGKPPTETADQSKAGQERRVEYSATYVFYVAKP